MHRWQTVAAIALAIAVVALVALPFDRVPPPPRADAVHSLVVSLHCPSPLVGAWSHDPPQSGWFGYAPLGGTLVPTVPGPCRAPSRRRLEGAGLLAAGAAFLAFSRRRAGSRSA